MSCFKGNIGKLAVGTTFVVFATLLFLYEQYWLTVILVLALMAVLKLDALAELVFSFADGMHIKFSTPPEKVEEDIKENDQPVTNENFVRFRNVEARILSNLQNRYGGEMKTLVHFIFGRPDKPEFRYTPDGSLQTEDTLYFFEIKYVLDPENAENIIKKTVQYLKEVHSKFSPSTGKRLVMKLILASGYDLSDMSVDLPEGIEIEFHRV